MISGSILAFVSGRFGVLLWCEKKREKTADHLRPLGFRPAGKDLGRGKPLPRGSIGQSGSRTVGMIADSDPLNHLSRRGLLRL